MKVIFYPAVTLDGFIADLEGGSDWVTEQDEALFFEVVRKAGCVIVGRKTFDQFEGKIYPIAGATTFVCSSQPAAGQKNTKELIFVQGSPGKILEIIASHGFTSTVLSGGADINGQFAKHGLIDELLVSIYPRLLGQGLPLFGKYCPSLNLSLVSSRQLSEGVLHLHYVVRKS